MEPAVCGDARRWEDARLAAAAFAVAPAGNGIVLRARPGPLRDAWLKLLTALLPAACVLRRVPCHISDERLLGGLDLGATLRAGRPVIAPGVLTQADQGVLLLAMAERLTASAAARYLGALDAGEVRVERDGFTLRARSSFGIVALDEGLAADERPPALLADRLGIWLDLSELPAPVTDGAPGVLPAAVAAARTRLHRVRLSPQLMRALCETALALGVTSVRAACLAVRVARAAAALDHREEAGAEDAALAARLVLAPRATHWPAVESEVPPGESSVAPLESGTASHEQAPSERRVPPATADGARSEERAVAAAQAALPGDLLALVQRGERTARVGAAGRAGAKLYSFTRGRPVGTVPGEPVGGARLHLLATLRAAAPWQRLRAAGPGQGKRRLEIRRGDLRITRFAQRARTTSVFLVDASGSTAVHRLGEAKGAVELLLAECYVRRDRVALLAFRKQGAELLLAPTRSLLRARRALAELPGGGGTPLASGIDAARELVAGIRRQGESAVVVVLTDGRANIARSGAPGRSAAQADALRSAQLLKLERVPALLLDTAPQASALAERLAHAMGAGYVALPRADAAAIAAAARLAAGAGGRKGSGRQP